MTCPSYVLKTMKCRTYVVIPMKCRAPEGTICPGHRGLFLDEIYFHPKHLLLRSGLRLNNYKEIGRDEEYLYDTALSLLEDWTKPENVDKAIEILLHVSSKPPLIETFTGSGIKIINKGVLEAYHALGKMYHYGHRVRMDLGLVSNF